MGLLKLLKNSHIRLLFTGSFFAVAFVAMAVLSYGVDIEVIKVFLIFSVLLVVGLIMASFLFSLVIRGIRRLFPYASGSSLLEKIEKQASENIDDELKASGQNQAPPR